MLLSEELPKSVLKTDKISQLMIYSEQASSQARDEVWQGGRRIPKQDELISQIFLTENITTVTLITA